MNMIKTIDNYITIVNKFMCYCSSLLTVFLMLLIVGDVLGRFLFHSPILGAVAISRNLLIAIMFLALPWVTSQNKHIRSELIIEKSKGKRRQKLNFIAFLFGILVFAGYASSLIKPTLAALRLNEMDIESTAYIPLFPFYTICFIGGLLSLYQIIKCFILNIVKPDDRSLVLPEEGGEYN